MKYFLIRFFWFVVIVVFVIAISVYFVLHNNTTSENIDYGVSFNVLYAKELGLDWREVYHAILTDLEVKHLRLAAHWPMVSPEEGDWNFEELDEQLRIANEHDVDVVLAVGRRLPRWPECHVPDWAKYKTWDEQKELLREYLRIVINRYKDNPAIVYWQVENEPFLTIYAQEQCGDLDKTFLDEEIALVRELDPSRPILVTDSGNLGTWYGAYKRGDSFGTSVYVYLWSATTGALETILPPESYILKQKSVEFLFGKKETILIELSVEPWLDRSVVDTDISLQLERMNIERFNKVLLYAQEIGFQKQYLWGAEWWYWLKEKQNHPEFWKRAKEVYK